MLGVADPEGRAKTRDLDKLKKPPEVNQTRFNKNKCKALYLGQDNQIHKYKVGNDWLGWGATGPGGTTRRATLAKKKKKTTQEGPALYYYTGMNRPGPNTLPGETPHL